jgi:signal transduction histidine kinase
LDKQVAAGLEIVARKGDLKQVLSNLLTNAIDATGERGRISVRVRPAIHWSTGSRGVRITVADNGTGMSPQVQARAFVPFFTTKAEVGTGIGLWVTKNLLEKQGGSIRCRSRQAAVSGTVMNIFLPLTSPERASSTPSQRDHA